MALTMWDTVTKSYDTDCLFRSPPPVLLCWNLVPQDKVPVPCTEEFMADVRAWEDINEDEDEEAMKLQYYGITDIAGITGKVLSLRISVKHLNITASGHGHGCLHRQVGEA